MSSLQSLFMIRDSHFNSNHCDIICNDTEGRCGARNGIRISRQSERNGQYHLTRTGFLFNHIIRQNPSKKLPKKVHCITSFLHPTCNIVFDCNMSISFTSCNIYYIYNMSCHIMPYKSLAKSFQISFPSTVILNCSP